MVGACVKRERRYFLCFSLKLFKVVAFRICIGIEFQYFTLEYTILFLSDVLSGFGRLNRLGFLSLRLKISDTGVRIKPLQIFHRKLPFLYLIKSENRRRLCLRKRGLVCKRNKSHCWFYFKINAFNKWWTCGRPIK